MSEIVHITFEKLTGLKGTIEGWFMWHGEFDLPLNSVLVVRGGGTLSIVFSWDQIYVQLFFPTGLSLDAKMDYLRHFEHGTNFLIKEWSNGRGEPIKHSQSPN